MDRAKGREWTVRLNGPVPYRRYSGLNEGNRETIFFEFDLPPGQREVPPEVYAVIKSVQYLERSPEHGGGRCNTGLECRRGIWQFPATHTGRTAADILDAKLADLAQQLDNEQSQTR